MTNSIHIDIELIKQVIADCVFSTPGVSENHKSFFNLNTLDNMIQIEMEDNILIISIKISVADGYYILSIPKNMQDNIYSIIKENFGFESFIHITVIDIVK